MSNLAPRRATSGSGTGVLQFPRLYEPQAETEVLSTSVVLAKGQGTELYDRFKSALDAVLTTSYVEQILRGVIAADSPFDAVYISALEPDTFNEPSTERLSAFSHVKDLSDSLTFCDEWDD